MSRLQAFVILATLAMVLVGCQGPGGAETRKLSGAVILNDPGAARTETGCTGSGEFSDLTVGLEVTIRNETGETIGSTGLSYDDRGGDDQCLFMWEVMIGSATTYSIHVGERPIGTYSVADLNLRNWGVGSTFGEP